jgi:hypothetical protein
MKKILPILFILPLLFSNCKKEEPILFEMVYAEDFTIPAGLNPVDAHYFRIKNISVGTYLSSRGLSADEMNSITPREGSFVNIFAGSATYNFLREVSIRIYTDDENDWKELFWHFNVPEDSGDNLALPASLEDVKEYFNGSTFNVEIKLNLRGTPIQNIDTQLRFSLGAK